MSETFKQQVEKYEHEPLIEAGEVRQDKVDTATESRAEQAVVDFEALNNKVEAATEQGADEKVLENLKTAENTTPVMTGAAIGRAYKNLTLKHELKGLRRQESFTERTLSRVIHQPFIRAVSEGAGKSISRPSGLLGGGLAAFLGSGSYFILAKYADFTYNYTVSLLLFGGGFVFGLALELFVHAATASHRQVD